MRCWAVVCALAGCSFHAHDVPRDGMTDAATDVARDVGPDTPARDCLAAWLDHTIVFDTPVPLTAVNGIGYDRDPFLSPDELTIYFSSVRTDSLPAGQPDIYRATRASIGDAFAAPVRFPTASTNSGYETKVSITADGGYLVVGSSQTGGAGGVDVWEATNPGSGFGGLSRTHVMMLDDSGNQQDPTISSDGLALYEAPDSTGTQQIMVATRQDRTHNFGAPQQIAELVDSDGYGTADPAISVDQRIILMSSARTGTAGQGDLWYATRASVNDPFGTPINVPGVGLNTASNEGDAHLSADGCRLYFASDRDTGMDWDLFVATAH